MITQDELDFFVKEFSEEDSALVNQALEECVKLFDRSHWNCMAAGNQLHAVWCWIAGWKKAKESPFNVEDSGFGKGMQFATGGIVKGFSISSDCNMSVLLESGETRVSKEVIEKYGTALLGKINMGELPADCQIEGETVVLVGEEST